MKMSQRRLCAVLFVIALCFPPARAEGPPVAQLASGRELLVNWRDGSESLSAAPGNAAIGATVRRNFFNLGWQQVWLPAGMNLIEGMAAYRKLDGVLAVEMNRPALRPLNPTGNEFDAMAEAPASPDPVPSAAEPPSELT